MPRIPRLIIPGVLVHVRCRFADGRFEFDDSARHQYLERLDGALTDSDWTLISYALMSSHIHLGLISGQSRLDDWIHPLNTAIAGWLSTRRRFHVPRALGPVFGDRPGTNLLPLERAFPLVAYHHNNPVHAGVVARARESHWTSHRQYLGCETRTLSVLDVPKGLELCAMSASELEAAVEQSAHRPTLVEGTPSAIVATVSAHLGVPIDDVMGGSKSPPAVFARRVAIATGASFQHSCACMSVALGISRTAAARLRKTSDAGVARTAREIVEHWRLAG